MDEYTTFTRKTALSLESQQSLERFSIIDSILYLNFMISLRSDHLIIN